METLHSYKKKKKKEESEKCAVLCFSPVAFK